MTTMWRNSSFSLSAGTMWRNFPSSLSAATATVNNPSVSHLIPFNFMGKKPVMPGLKACSAEFGCDKPLNGTKITVSCHKAAITESLTELGATVRSCSCSCNMLSTQDHNANDTAAASDSSSIFAQKRETRQICWKCINRGLDWGAGDGPDAIIDDNGDAIYLIMAGVKAEQIYAQNGGLPEPSEFQTVLMDGLKTDPKRYHNVKEGLRGVSVGTTAGSERILLLSRFLCFPVLDISDFVTKNKYINMYGSRCSILAWIRRATNMKISGKTALVCGFDDDASEGCAMALKQGGANVVVAEADPNHDTQARLRGFPVIKSSDNVVPDVDIFVVDFSKGNVNVLNNVKNMKNNAVIYNTGPILDHNSSTYDALIEPYFSGMDQIIVDCRTDKWFSSDTDKCVIVVSNPGYPNLMPSWSATAHVVAMLELMSQKETGKYVGKVYAFPEHLEEVVSDLHLGELKAAVAKKETDGQASDLVSVPSQERVNLFTTAPAGAMNMSKMLIMVIQVVPIIGALAYAFSKVSKAELSFSAIWGGGN